MLWTCGLRLGFLTKVIKLKFFNRKEAVVEDCWEDLQDAHAPFDDMHRVQRLGCSVLFGSDDPT